MAESSLPPEVLELAEFEPLEDLLLVVLREAFPPGFRIQSLIEDDQEFPMILVRRQPDWGWWDGDGRFIDYGVFQVDCFCAGIEADSDAARLANAVRGVLRRSVNKVVPGVGWLTRCELLQSPRRVPDWATSSGPVQYADLPTGVQRYEMSFEFSMRRPLS